MHSHGYKCPAMDKKLISSKFAALNADARAEAVKLFEQAGFPTTVTQVCISNEVLLVMVQGKVVFPSYLNCNPAS